MSLSDWLERGWLVTHSSSKQEIKALLSIVDRDINQSRTIGLEPDWQLNIAYNAALQLATVALAASGYRAAREAHHYRSIQSLAFTIGADKNLVRQLDDFRKKRHISDYEQTGMVTQKEAGEMIALAQELRDKVTEWLKKNRPELTGK
jgi:cell fate (sporulation/competence/biofilm development) regulator YlbF (YheA/YmcA/DUF963 family)